MKKNALKKRKISTEKKKNEDNHKKFLPPPQQSLSKHKRIECLSSEALAKHGRKGIRE